MSGSYVPIAADGDLLLYRREGRGGVIVVALNLGAEPAAITSEMIGLDGEILLSTHLDRQGEVIHGTLDLRGNEGVIIGTAQP
jgi:alpha-glucosidase